MICLDTNIIIAISKGDLDLGLLMEFEVIHPSVVKIEALGYKNLLTAEDRYIREIFALSAEISLSTVVTERTIELRQLTKIGLADAIIAATAMSFEAELWTVNTRDFKGIDGLKLLNPLS